MAYQLGPSGVVAFKKMLAALEAGDRIAAAEAALDSKWATQTPNRAQRVAALIRG
jgi:lysozyme